MRSKGLAILVVACLVVGVFSYEASADGREPGSCLLFPFYNSFSPAFNVSVMTITNTSEDPVWVRLVWIDGHFFPPVGGPFATNLCSPEDRWIWLSGNDTFTFTDQSYNPAGGEIGYMYAYAVTGNNDVEEYDHNFLIGNEVVFFFGITGAFPVPGVIWSMNPVAYSAKTLEVDGYLKLDGTEYDAAPKQVFFPRFFGQLLPSPFASLVILINLTGGQWFEQLADVQVYNDNEEGFSSQRLFPCWEINFLWTVSTSTLQTFLLDTDHDPDEIFDGSPPDDPNVVGDEHVESGWIEFLGLWAWNPGTGYLITKPSMYAVLIETAVGLGFTGFCDLPWQIPGDDDGYVNAGLYSIFPDGSH
jgi:hypothetical protein